MICPNDKTEMHPVRIVAHYGQPMVIDQCEKCGGVWFDEMELFRARQGEADKIELMDADALLLPSIGESSELLCPRDQSVMRPFTDRHFPQDLVLVRCFSCYGIWLNRGVFAHYQRFRQEWMSARERSGQDKELEGHINELIDSHRSGEASKTIRRLGEFLSAPVDEYASLSPSYSNGRSVPGDAVGAGLSILIAVLRALILRH